MIKIHEMITEEIWIQKEGLSFDGKRRCSIQHICHAYPKSATLKLKKFAHVVARGHGTTDFRAIANWNDASDRTFAEVKEAFKKADL